MGSDTMNARTVAEEAASWYFRFADPYAPHAHNVQTVLRKTVLSLTLKYLKPDSISPGRIAGCPGLELVDSDTERNAKNGNSWNQFLKRASMENESWSISRWDEKDEETYNTLLHREKARMDALLEGCMLTLPEDDRILPMPQKHSPRMSPKAAPKKGKLIRESGLSEEVGLAGMQRQSSTDSHASSGNSEETLPTSLLRQISLNSTNSKYQQMLEIDLKTRLELYVRSLVRVKKQKRECVVALEPKKAILARLNSVVNAFLATVASVRSMNPVLTRLLESMTKELLAVETLAPDLEAVIQRVVSRYDHQTSFASLAFLSSPEKSAETHLEPLLMTYMQYIRSNWRKLVDECELERMLTTIVDPELRSSFKTIEFRSIGHLLEVCQGYRHLLQNIQLPPNMGGMKCSFVHDSGMEDLCLDSKAIHQALRDLQRETIAVNGHVLPPANSRKELIQLLSEALNSRTILHQHKKKSNRRSKRICKSVSFPDLPVIQAQLRSLDENDSIDNDVYDTEEDLTSGVSSGNEGDNERPTSRKVGFEKRKTNQRNSGKFRMDMVDMMTRRLLIAGCRTGTGGDAYYVVRDLFGGEDVEVVPSKEMSSYGRMSRFGIEINVRLTNVSIKCHGSFDIYPKPLNGTKEPLVQVHTTTTETISLQEVRASDSSGEEEDNREGPNGGSVLVLQEKKTEKTGWRTLSVRPALYEAVEVWNTPS